MTCLTGPKSRSLGNLKTDGPTVQPIRGFKSEKGRVSIIASIRQECFLKGRTDTGASTATWRGAGRRKEGLLRPVSSLSACDTFPAEPTLMGQQGRGTQLSVTDDGAQGDQLAYEKARS